MTMIWVLERDIFPDRHERLRLAAIQAGGQVVDWDDAWLTDDNWPELSDSFVLFHGSLENAYTISQNFPWQPGVFCNTPAYHCSAWYDQAKPWLVHNRCVFSTVKDFVANPDQYLEEIESKGPFFVRPDSPLKLFAGRVLTRAQLTLESLDYGFYYDDENLPIVIAPLANIENEWRFVICNQCPITVSSYEAIGRQESAEECPPNVWIAAEEVAANLTPPDPVYILDLCLCNNLVKVLEINPFSGADLYACDRNIIVESIAKL